MSSTSTKAEFDRAHGDLGRRVFHAPRAEVGHVTYPHRSRGIEKADHRIGEAQIQYRRYQIHPVDAGQGGFMGGRVGPGEDHVGARASRRTNVDPRVAEQFGDAATGLAGAA